MIEWWKWALGFISGLALGFLYFYGLWLTVRRLPQSKSPGMVVMFSYLLRLLILLAAFYGLILWLNWQGLIAAFLGLITIRIILARRLGRDLSGNPAPLTDNTDVQI